MTTKEVYDQALVTLNGALVDGDAKLIEASTAAIAMLVLMPGV